MLGLLFNYIETHLFLWTFGLFFVVTCFKIVEKMQDLPVTLKDHFGRFQASLPFSEQVTSKAWELLTKLYPKIEQVNINL